jgi:hypothetical protein
MKVFKVQSKKYTHMHTLWGLIFFDAYGKHER